MFLNEFERSYSYQRWAKAQPIQICSHASCINSWLIITQRIIFEFVQTDSPHSPVRFHLVVNKIMQRWKVSNIINERIHIIAQTAQTWILLIWDSKLLTTTILSDANSALWSFCAIHHTSRTDPPSSCKNCLPSMSSLPPVTSSAPQSEPPCSLSLPHFLLVDCTAPSSDMIVPESQSPAL